MVGCKSVCRRHTRALLFIPSEPMSSHGSRQSQRRGNVMAPPAARNRSLLLPPALFILPLPTLTLRGYTSLPFPSPLSSLPYLPSPLEVGPIVAAPQLVPPNVLWCILSINLHPFDCLMTNNFSCVLSTERKFP